MLARYKIYRGKPPAGVQLPTGLRQDTRKHTQHCLRPTAESVALYLADPSAAAWKQFSTIYLKTIEQRWLADSSAFDKLAKLSLTEDVYLGCSCPTTKNPNVQHCHTVLALQFMRERYPKLSIVLPQS